MIVSASISGDLTKMPQLTFPDITLPLMLMAEPVEEKSRASNSMP